MIAWEEPPTPNRRRWVTFAEELKAQPGKSARVVDEGQAAFSFSRAGSIAASLRDKGLKVSTRRLDANLDEWGLWARWENQ